MEEAEGYKLILSSNNSTGYLGVTKQQGGKSSMRSGSLNASPSTSATMIRR